MTDWEHLRKQTRLTRLQLAAKLGTSRQTVRRWEEVEEKTPSLAYQRQMRELVATHGQATDGGEA